jgi:hypothetical protein
MSAGLFFTKEGNGKELSFEGIIIERIGDFLRGTSELFEIVTINF